MRVITRHGRATSRADSTRPASMPMTPSAVSNVATGANVVPRSITRPASLKSRRAVLSLPTRPSLPKQKNQPSAGKNGGRNMGRAWMSQSTRRSGRSVRPKRVPSGTPIASATSVTPVARSKERASSVPGIVLAPRGEERSHVHRRRPEKRVSDCCLVAPARVREVADRARHLARADARSKGGPRSIRR